MIFNLPSRIAAQLRRIAKALEVANDLSRERIEREDSMRTYKSRPFQFSRGDTEKWNEKYGDRG
jgi:hypothetical protein